LQSDFQEGIWIQNVREDFWLAHHLSEILFNSYSIKIDYIGNGKKKLCEVPMLVRLVFIVTHIHHVGLLYTSSQF